MSSWVITAVASSGASRRTNSVTSARLRACSTSPTSLQRSRYSSVARTGRADHRRARDRGRRPARPLVRPARRRRASAAAPPVRHPSARPGPAGRPPAPRPRRPRRGSPGTKRSIASTAAPAAMLAAPSPRSVARRRRPVTPIAGGSGCVHGTTRAARRRPGPSSALGGCWAHAAPPFSSTLRQPARVPTERHADEPLDPTPPDRLGERRRRVAGMMRRYPHPQRAPARSRSVAASRSAVPRRRRPLRSTRDDRTSNVSASHSCQPRYRETVPAVCAATSSATSAAVRTWTTTMLELPAVHAHPRPRTHRSGRACRRCSRSA